MKCPICKGTGWTQDWKDVMWGVSRNWECGIDVNIWGWGDVHVDTPGYAQRGWGYAPDPVANKYHLLLALKAENKR